MKSVCLLLLASCFGVTTVVRPRPVCGRLDPADIVEFHTSHDLSVGANVSSVEGLALGDDDGDAGTGWVVCVEHGVAKIRNHSTQQEEGDCGALDR